MTYHDKTLVEQLADAEADVREAASRMAKWNDRHAATDLGTYEAGLASRCYDRAQADYRDARAEVQRITRQERDHAKHQALEHRKARSRAEDERDAYRRGQGPAPTPATPGTTALHETHPIPNSRGDDQ